jgi:hypothetical protein
LSGVVMLKGVEVWFRRNTMPVVVEAERRSVMCEMVVVR